jgi:DNA adenine methylase
MQIPLFQHPQLRAIEPFSMQLLKWVGNKQRLAHRIAAYFPPQFGTYYEPFLGSAAVLGTLAPVRAVGSDCFKPLIELWQTLRTDPDRLTQWYSERWRRVMAGDKVEEYEKVKAAYNQRPNAADLLFICRSCYGGVVRFRQADGHISTPCGIHAPISPASFAERVKEWHCRTKGTRFVHLPYAEAMAKSEPGDMIYCDPPYSYSQSILYGAQSFSLEGLLVEIERCKTRGVFVALSIDGSKRSGELFCQLQLPPDLFEREVFIDCGRSMLRRFQMDGQTLEGEMVSDRLLLTY